MSESGGNGVADDRFDRVIVSAQMAAVAACMRYAALSFEDATRVASQAIWEQAREVASKGMSADALRVHLTLHGIRAIFEGNAGRQPRELLVDRVDSLPVDQKLAYSLRREHGLADWQIAAIMNITEDEVVTIILQALLVINGLHASDYD